MKSFYMILKIFTIFFISGIVQGILTTSLHIEFPNLTTRMAFIAVVLVTGIAVGRVYD